jgi:hypothetical protein
VVKCQEAIVLQDIAVNPTTNFSKGISMKIPLLIASFCVATSVAQAAAVEPKLTRFGSIGGSLPTSGNSWAISEFRESGGRGLTLGLTASTRNGDPGQTVNNSAGAFFTSSGLGLNLPAGVDNLARWDLGVYFASSNPRLGNTAIALLYDFDPAPGTDESNHGVLFTPGTIYIDRKANPGDLSHLLFPQSTSPIGFTSFDPAALGTYTFALVAYQYRAVNGVYGLAEEGRVAISVTTSLNPVSAIPEPGAFAMLLVGLGLVCGFTRTRFTRTRYARNTRREVR